MSIKIIISFLPLFLKLFFFIQNNALNLRQFFFFSSRLCWTVCFLYALTLSLLVERKFSHFYDKISREENWEKEHKCVRARERGCSSIFIFAKQNFPQHNHLFNLPESNYTFHNHWLMPQSTSAAPWERAEVVEAEYRILVAEKIHIPCHIPIWYPCRISSTSHKFISQKLNFCRGRFFSW